MSSLINYKPPPTIKKFILDHREGALFYDWIVGPVGSGKTTGLFFKLVYMASLQEPSPDGVRRTRAVIVRNCYDDQTEILTESRGWQLFRNLQEDDKVAMRAETGEMVFVAPTLHYKAPYKGPMLGCRKQNLDFLVTPDHNLWTATINGRTKVRAAYKFEPAREAYGLINREFTLVSGPAEGQTEYSTDFFEFLGFWFAEGYAGVYEYPDRERPHYRLVVSQKIAIEYARDVITRAGLTFGETHKGDGNYNLTIHQHERTKLLTEELATCGKAVSKAVPAWIKQAPAAHLRAFLHGFTMGDGHFRNAGHDTTRLYTTSKQLADDLQEMAARSGNAAIVNKRDRTGQTQEFRGQTINCGVLYSVTLLTDTRSHPCPQNKDDWYTKDYDGDVYCVEVPTHIVYVRRNGKPLWCSQTMPQLKDTTLVSWDYWFHDGVAGKWFATEKNFLLKFNDCECMVMFRPLDTEDDIARVLSLEINFAIIDEFVQIPRKVVDALSARLGRFKLPDGTSPTNWGLWGSSNPSTEDNWWFDYLHRNSVEPRDNLPAEPVAHYFHQPGGLTEEAENIENLPGGRDYYIEQCAGKPEAYIKQFVDAEWGFSISGKAVVPTFKVFHVSPVPLIYNPNLPLVVGVDPGLAGSALIFGQYDLHSRLIVLGELVQSGMGAKRIIQERLKPYLGKRFPGAEPIIAPDPASQTRQQTDERAVIDEFRKHYRCSVESNNRMAIRTDAIEHFTTRLTDVGPALLVDPKECPVLVRALKGGWRYEVNQKGDTAPTVDKKNPYSHPGDGFGYLCRYFHKLNEREERYGPAARSSRGFQVPKQYGNQYHLR